MWIILLILIFYTEAGLSQADKDFILKKHNDLRQKMTNGEITNQPRAINMKTMVRKFYLNSQFD